MTRKLDWKRDDYNVGRFADVDGYRIVVKYVDLYDTGNDLLAIMLYRVDADGFVIRDGSEITTGTAREALALIAAARQFEQKTERAS